MSPKAEVRVKFLNRAVGYVHDPDEFVRFDEPSSDAVPIEAQDDDELSLRSANSSTRRTGSRGAENDSGNGGDPT